MSNKVYEIVTDKIKAKLESGVIPWRQPWVNKRAINWQTQRAYRGINTMLLDPGEYTHLIKSRQAGRLKGV